MSEQEIPQVELSVEGLLQAAQDATGLSDFGDESFREPFEVLVKALNEEANLNAVGRFTQYQRILNILCNRLRTEAWIARHPEILDEEINGNGVVVVPTPALAAS